MFTRKKSRSRESAVSQGTEEIIATDIEGRGEGDQGDIFIRFDEYSKKD